MLISLLKLALIRQQGTWHFPFLQTFGFWWIWGQPKVTIKCFLRHEYFESDDEESFLFHYDGLSYSDCDLCGFLTWPYLIKK